MGADPEQGLSPRWAGKSRGFGQKSHEAGGRSLGKPPCCHGQVLPCRFFGALYVLGADFSQRRHLLKINTTLLLKRIPTPLKRFIYSIICSFI